MKLKGSFWWEAHSSLVKERCYKTVETRGGVVFQYTNGIYSWNEIVSKSRPKKSVNTWSYPL